MGAVRNITTSHRDRETYSNGKEDIADSEENGTPHAFSAACTRKKVHPHLEQCRSDWDCPCHGSIFSSEPVP